MESIVYAVDWNQGRENVLSGAAWLGGSGAGGAEVIEQLRKPTALVCSAKGVEKNPLADGRKKRDELLLEMISSAVAKGGTVLIPTDTSARVLELAYLLEHAWRKEVSNSASDSPLKTSKLYLASRNVGATMRYARSMLEWMDENVVRELEAETGNAGDRQHKRTDSKQTSTREKDQSAGKPSGPFDFKHLKLIERKSQVEKLTSKKAARVILASDTSLEWGFSREILQKIATEPSNLIILTKDYGTNQRDNHQQDGLGRTLWRWYQERRDGVALETGLDGQNLEQVHTGGRDLIFNNAERIALEGKEISIYQQYLATQSQLRGSLQLGNGTNLETSADALDETSSTSSSSTEESDPERQGKALNTSATLAHSGRNKSGLNKETLGVNILLRQVGVYDYDVRGKKGREMIFPFISKRRRGDDFGDLIRPEEYLRAEERDEVDGQDMRDNASGKQIGLGQKRKWEDSGLQMGTGRRNSVGASKRRRKEADSSTNITIGEANGDVPVNGHGAGEEDESSDGSDEEPEEFTAGPSKIIFNMTLVQSNLRIAYVDFAGIHDQRSLSMLIPLIQPRKLILIGGNASETAFLAEECRPKVNSRSISNREEDIDDVLTPANGQTVSASVDTNTWTVRLSEALARRFHWQNVRGLGIVTLMGRLDARAADEQPQADSMRKRRKLLKTEPENLTTEEVSVESENTMELTPTLDVLPASMAAATRSVAQPLHVGDLRLADLRKILQSNGHLAEFRGEGTLLIDGLVAVRKSGTGRIEVEGGGLEVPETRTREFEGSFYAVRRKIYEGLAIIAGG